MIVRRRRVSAAIATSLPDLWKVHPQATFEPPCALLGNVASSTSQASVGAFTYSWSALNYSVDVVGRYCSIGSDVAFGAVQHPTDWISTSSFVYDGNFPLFADMAKGTAFEPQDRPVVPHTTGIRIGHDVWIGDRAFIRSGVQVGTGAIVGTNAVVTKDVPPYAIVVGNPGRIVKYRFHTELIARMLNSQWWRFSFTEFAGADLADPSSVLNKLTSSTTATEYRPGFYAAARRLPRMSPTWRRVG